MSQPPELSQKQLSHLTPLGPLPPPAEVVKVLENLVSEVEKGQVTALFAVVLDAEGHQMYYGVEPQRTDIARFVGAVYMALNAMIDLNTEEGVDLYDR